MMKAETKHKPAAIPTAELITGTAADPADINARKLIESTRGILIGEAAGKYNQLITDLLHNLIRLRDAGKLYTIPGPNDSEAERLRIATTEGELYYRRRGTLYARNISKMIIDTYIEIKALLNAACNNDADMLGAELAAEAEISRTEKIIEADRCGYVISQRRPGETAAEAITEIRALTHTQANRPATESQQPQQPPELRTS